MMTNEEMATYDYMVEMDIATPQELNLARNLVSGSWMEVLNAVLYVRTGYHDLQQYIHEEMEDKEE